MQTLQAFLATPTHAIFHSWEGIEITISVWLMFSGKMNWTEIKNELYYRDGSLRDIYVFETTRIDWEKWVHYVNDNYRIEWVNGRTNQVEHKIDFNTIVEFWDRNQNPVSTAHVYIDRIQINAHFFVDDEFENDISPSEFNSIEDHEKLIKYLTDLSRILNKEIVLTAENMRDVIHLRVTQSGNILL